MIIRVECFYTTCTHRQLEQGADIVEAEHIPRTLSRVSSSSIPVCIISHVETLCVQLLPSQTLQTLNGMLYPQVGQQ